MFAVLWVLGERGKVATQPGLALRDKPVIYPRSRDKSGDKDSLRRKDLRVTKRTVKLEKLAASDTFSVFFPSTRIWNHVPRSTVSPPWQEIHRCERSGSHTGYADEVRKLWYDQI